MYFLQVVLWVGRFWARDVLSADLGLSRRFLSTWCTLCGPRSESAGFKHKMYSLRAWVWVGRFWALDVLSAGLGLSQPVSSTWCALCGPGWLNKFSRFLACSRQAVVVLLWPSWRCIIATSKQYCSCECHTTTHWSMCVYFILINTAKANQQSSFLRSFIVPLITISLSGCSSTVCMYVYMYVCINEAHGLSNH